MNFAISSEQNKNETEGCWSLSSARNITDNSGVLSSIVRVFGAPALLIKNNPGFTCKDDLATVIG